MQVYYMASSMGRQEEPNFPKSHIINLLLAKLVRSRQLNSGLILFFLRFYWSLPPSRSIYTQKKNLANISAILNSRLVNNPYVSNEQPFKSFWEGRSNCLLNTTLPQSVGWTKRGERWGGADKEQKVEVSQGFWITQWFLDC